MALHLAGTIAAWAEVVASGDADCITDPGQDLVVSNDAITITFPACDGTN